MKNLNEYAASFYSQYGEDGILYEIFRRIGAANKIFVEFGCHNGDLSTGQFLLCCGWSGYWIEGNKKLFKIAKKKFKHEKRLKVKHSFLTINNIESIFVKMNIPIHFDMLSIDVDGNDYWLWNSLKHYIPRTVIIEYNSHSEGEHVSPYLESLNKYRYEETKESGTSLKSLEILGKKKGYALIGSTQANLFFVLEEYKKLFLQ
jgi:hypothetical protein